MHERTSYIPDFEADRLPVWFLDEEETIAYHLYPDCGHIEHRSEYELSKMTIKWGTENFDSFEEWQDQIKSKRHMCKHCLSRFQNDLWDHRMN